MKAMIPNSKGLNTYDPEREKDIIRLRTGNPPLTLQAIANKYGLTRERVRQILKKNGIVGCAVWDYYRKKVAEQEISPEF